MVDTLNFSFRQVYTLNLILLSSPSIIFNGGDQKLYVYAYHVCRVYVSYQGTVSLNPILTIMLDYILDILVF